MQYFTVWLPGTPFSLRLSFPGNKHGAQMVAPREPFGLALDLEADALRSSREWGPATAGFCPITNRPG
jgi:hypothetical protein